MKSIFFSRKKGFTLIELVVVIVVLAIIAAIGVPQFVTLGTEARTATVNGIKGAVLGAVVLSRAKYRVSGETSPISMDGVSVEVTSDGMPCATSAGIGEALFSIDGFVLGTPSGTNCNGNKTITIRPEDESTNSNCQVLYRENGTATVTTTGC